MNIAAILAGIKIAEKIVPIIEAVGSEIGPLVQTELADGKAIWADVIKAYDDLKAAYATVKAAASVAQPMK